MPTQALAPGWLELSSGDSQALLEPFLSCTSPGDFLALQRRVDMPRLVERLTELLEQLPSLGPALEARGIKPSAYTERDFQWSDVGRGLSRAAKDALSTSPVVNSAQSTLMALHALQAQLPPPYQRALDAVEHEQLARRFSTGSVAVGVVDHMTFGVPLGFYGLVAGTGQGAHSLVRGRYEQAVRELAPAAMLVALYAGGKSAPWLSEVISTSPVSKLMWA